MCLSVWWCGTRTMQWSGWRGHSNVPLCGWLYLLLSSTPQPAQCGISRIWVFSQHRRKKIATRLIECVRSVSQSCVVAKSRKFWWATEQSNLADRIEEFSTGQTTVVLVRKPNFGSCCCSQCFCHIFFSKEALSINALHACVYICIWQLSSIRVPMLWFINLTVATCRIQHTFLSLCQFFYKKKHITTWSPPFS